MHPSRRQFISTSVAVPGWHLHHHFLIVHSAHILSFFKVRCVEISLVLRSGVITSALFLILESRSVAAARISVMVTQQYCRVIRCDFIWPMFAESLPLDVRCICRWTFVAVTRCRDGHLSQDSTLTTSSNDCSVAVIASGSWRLLSRSRSRDHYYFWHMFNHSMFPQLIPGHCRIP